VPKNSIKITNLSTQAANCGIGMWGGTCVFERNLKAGGTVLFKVEPEYWVGVFYTELQRGQVVDDTIALASNRIKFEGDNNVAIVIAKAEGEKIILNVEYTRRDYPFLKDLSNFFITLLRTIFIAPFVILWDCFRRLCCCV